MSLERCCRRQSWSIFRYQHLVGRTEENNEKPHLGHPFSWVRFRDDNKAEMLNAMLFPIIRKIK
jgi:hypothetical protein